MIIIDGKNKVFGRLSSVVAKMLLQGNQVTVVNVNKIIRTQTAKAAVAEIKQKNTPGRENNCVYMFRRCIRGMLPKGKKSYRKVLESKQLKLFVDIPKHYEGSDCYELKDVERSGGTTTEEIVNQFKI